MKHSKSAITLIVLIVVIVLGVIALYYILPQFSDNSLENSLFPSQQTEQKDRKPVEPRPLKEAVGEIQFLRGEVITLSSDERSVIVTPKTAENEVIRHEELFPNRVTVVFDEETKIQKEVLLSDEEFNILLEQYDEVLATIDPNASSEDFPPPPSQIAFEDVPLSLLIPGTPVQVVAGENIIGMNSFTAEQIIIRLE